MRNLARGMIAALALCAAQAARADDRAPTTTNAAPTAPSARTAQGDAGSAQNQITGPVRTIDPVSRTLYLKNSMRALSLSDDVKVTKDGKDTTWSAINEGDEVRASYTPAGEDRLHVQKIEILTRSGDEHDARSKTDDATRSQSRVEDQGTVAPMGTPSGQSGRNDMPVPARPK